MLLEQQSKQIEPKVKAQPSPIVASTEANLVTQLRQGCVASYNNLFDMYSAMLFGVILRIVKNDDDAQNIMQDTFVKIWLNIGQYDASKGRLATWLLNIARNTAIDFTRSKLYLQRSKNQNIEQNVGFETDRLKTQTPIDTIGLRQLVTTLPAHHRELIEWMYFEGFTQQEIADKLGIPLGTVKNRIYHAMQQLRKIFNT